MFFKLNRWLHRKGFSRQKLKGSWMHRWFGDVILLKELWSFRADPLAKAWLIGMIVTTIPLIPGQSVIAIFLAVFFRANLPLAILLQFLSCPPTAPIHLPVCFFTGAFVLGDMPSEVFAKAGAAFSNGMFSKDGLKYIVEKGILPLYLGSFIVGPILGGIGYFAIKYFWKEKPRTVMVKQPESVRKLEKVASWPPDDK